VTSDDPRISGGGRRGQEECVSTELV